MRDLLTSLPTHLASVVICNWLSLASIVHLDSAYCNRKLRRELLNFLRSVEFIHSHYTGLEDPSMLMWLVLRQAHVQRVVVDFRRDVLIADEYLKFGGNDVQRLELRNSLPRDLLLVAAQCRNLRYLIHRNSHFNDSFVLSLRHNSMLLELRLDQIQYHPPWEPKHTLALPHLRLFSMRNSRCSEKLLAKLVGSSTQLRVFDVYHTTGVTPKVLLWIARRCPLLTSLGLGKINLQDETLVDLCVLCRNILHLDLSLNLELSDLSIECVPSYMCALKSINLEGCIRLTEQTFVYLAGRKDTLECLRADEPFFAEGAILSWCLKQCVKCTSFGIKQRPFYNTDRPLSTTLLASLTHMITLSVCDLNITDEKLGEIALNCRHLQHLCLFSTMPSRLEFTRTGLLAIVGNCVHLALLLVQKTRFYDPFLDRNAFVSLRPGLKMITSMESTVFEYSILKCEY